MVVRSDWLSRNSVRKYPVSDTSSATSDSGEQLPEGFLVDANIWMSDDPAYKYLYLSSATITEHLVSVTILGAEDAYTQPSEFVPMAVLTVNKPLDLYRNYAIEPLVDGIRGWLAFGPAVLDANIALSFSYPSQTALVPKAVRCYQVPQVTSMSTINGFASILDDIKVVAASPLIAEIREVLVDELPVRALVLSLVPDTETMQEFIGPCGGRVESNTCRNTPILSISGVTPDCDGNIDIDFQGLTVRAFTGGGGLCIDSPVSLTETCDDTNNLPDSNGILPGEINWERPCDLVVPYNADFGSVDVMEELVIDGGSSYYDIDDGSVWMAVGGADFAMSGPCFQSAPVSEDVVSRNHTIGFAAPEEGAQPGMVVMDTINTRIVIESTGSGTTAYKYNKGTKQKEGDLGSGPAGSTFSADVHKDGRLVLKVGGAEVVDMTFEPGDPYFDTNGKVGAYAGGQFSTNVELTAYSVEDTDA